MRLPKRSDRGSLEFNMTPMIDVTFQLIIFFLLANRFSQQGAEVEKDVPKATQGKAGAGDPAKQILVNVSSNGRLQLGATDVEMSKFEAELKKAPADAEVRIRSDAATPFGQVRPVIQKCFDNKFGNLTFAVKPATVDAASK